MCCKWSKTERVFLYLVSERDVCCLYVKTVWLDQVFDHWFRERQGCQVWIGAEGDWARYQNKIEVSWSCPVPIITLGWAVERHRKQGHLSYSNPSWMLWLSWKQGSNKKQRTLWPSRVWKCNTPAPQYLTCLFVGHLRALTITARKSTVVVKNLLQKLTLSIYCLNTDYFWNCYIKALY